MPASEEPQRIRVIELVKLIASDSVQTLQLQRVAIIEAQRNVDWLDQFETKKRTYESLRLRQSGVQPSERGLNPPKSLAWLFGLVEKRLAVRGREPGMLGIDRNVFA